MKFVVTALFLIFSPWSFGQRCATDEYQRLHPALPNASIEMARGAKPAAQRDTLREEVIVIPVVVHIVYNNSRQNISDEQVQAQIDALNRDFRRRNQDTTNTPAPFKHLAADTRISFCLAQVDPKGYKTTGIVRRQTKEPLFLADDQMKHTARGGSDAWDASKYLNIWVCDLFGRTLGYATTPGANPRVDGVVIQYGVFGYVKNVTAPFNKGRTLTHEVGHWLGLKHIWGDVEGGECASDDVDDTPPQAGSNSGCSVFPKVSVCSVNEFGDMFMNYMDFSDDGCMNMFTHGQKIKMRSQFAAGGFRNSFLGSNLCNGTDAGEAPPAEEPRSDIKIYPNPVVQYLHLERQNQDLPATLLVYNPEGRLLISKSVPGRQLKISVASLPDGLYLAVLVEGRSRRSFKIVKHSSADKR